MTDNRTDHRTEHRSDNSMADRSGKRALRLLIVDDSDDDAELLLHELRLGGYEPIHVRVDTPESLKRALRESWQVVICDFMLPNMEVADVQAALRATLLDVPFIVISGVITEEIAVTALKNGADDFLLKSKLARLIPAIERELRAVEERRQTQEALAHQAFEQRKLQAQLMISDRLASVGALAGGVAHEINNPMTSVLSNLDFALQRANRLTQGGAPNDAPLDVSAHNTLVELTRELSESKQAALRVSDIVRDLKLLSGTDNSSRERVEVEAMLESALRMVATEIRPRARIIRSYRASAAVDANRGLMTQVLVNLLMNAAQAIALGLDDEQAIEVSIDLEGRRENQDIGRQDTGREDVGRVVIGIRDTGIGMEQAIMDRLFSPFFTTKPVGVGTGLGLSLCQRIVTDLGGEIRVDSEPGEGSLFRVFLPLSAAEVVRPSARSAPAIGSAWRARVLIVDDEPAICGIARKTLEDEHDVDIETSAQQALDKISGGARYHLILCDLMMPGMTGKALHDRLLALAPDQAARMVFVTGGALTPEHQRFLDATAGGYLEKPFMPSTLRKLVNQRLSSERPAQ